MSESRNIANMTAEELEQHIKVVDERHRRLMVSLRALWKARLAEEAVAGRTEEDDA